MPTPLAMHVILFGDLADGINEIIGPFATHDDATTYAENELDGNWYIVPLTTPDNPLGEAIYRVLDVSFAEADMTDLNLEPDDEVNADWYYNDMQLNFARREEQGAEETVLVWVTEHDSEDVAWVINDIDDMRTNFDDHVKEGTVAEGATFEDYLDTWEGVEVPKLIATGDQDVRDSWVAAYMRRHYKA